MSATLKETYEAIESEFSYQRERWGDGGCNHEIASWITYMRSYLDEAGDIASHNSPETPALDTIRKVVSMGIQCMMEHGAPKR